LEAIHDDDPLKNGVTYRNLDVPVLSTNETTIDNQSDFLITSLESARPILRRLVECQVRKIIAPIVS